MLSLSKSLWGAYEKGDFTDMTIVCGDKEFHIHKIVICSQSKVFAAMARPPFTESESNTITLKDDDVQTFESALEYFYHGDYSNPPADKKRTADALQTTPLSHHALVYAFADKYDVRRLAEISADRYKEKLPHYQLWHDLGNDYHTYKDLPEEVWSDFFASVSLVYSTTPDRNRWLRDQAIHGIRRSCTFLKKHAGKAIQDKFERLLKEEERMSEELMDNMMRYPFLLCTCCFKVADASCARMCNCCEERGVAAFVSD